MKARIFARAVLFNERGEVLLLRRSMADADRPGDQDFPGGTIEPGEDIGTGMSREIFEEAGIHIDQADLRLFYGRTLAYDTFTVTKLMYWARVDSSTVKLSFEHDDFHWATVEDALREFPHPVYGVGLAFGVEHMLFNYES